MSEPVVLSSAELNELNTALEFHDQGFTPWSDEKVLFLKAARAYADLMRQDGKESDDAAKEPL